MLYRVRVCVIRTVSTICSRRSASRHFIRASTTTCT